MYVYIYANSGVGSAENMKSKCLLVFRIFGNFFKVTETLMKIKSESQKELKNSHCISNDKREHLQCFYLWYSVI